MILLAAWLTELSCLQQLQLAAVSYSGYMLSVNCFEFEFNMWQILVALWIFWINIILLYKTKSRVMHLFS